MQTHVDQRSFQETAVETRHITVITAGLGVPSSSRLLADQLAAAASRELSSAGYTAEVDIVELRDLAVDIANNFVTGYAAPRLAEVLAGVAAADGIIAVSPVFSASYSGLFKSFVDILDPGSMDGKAVLLGATGGSDRHQMVLDYAMRPLFTYLRTRITPTAVFAGPQDWGNDGGGGSPLSARTERAAAEFAEMLAAAPRRAMKSSGGHLQDLESLPFEQLLAGISGGRTA